MQVHAITTPIVHVQDDLDAFLFSNVPQLQERTVLVITSKVVALCEGAVAEKVLETRDEKHALVRQQAELYTEPHSSRFNLMLTVKNQILAVNAGIDESNADGRYVLFPQQPYQSAANIWDLLRQKHQIKELGVIIIDSKTIPLKWGTIGTALAHCGFQALNNRIGETDLFGKEMQMTQENIVEALAVAANFEMGEVAESRPMALITDIDKVVFQDRPPTQEEIAELAISIEDDAYSPILTKAEWKKGGCYQSRAENKKIEWFADREQAHGKGESQT